MVSLHAEIEFHVIIRYELKIICIGTSLKMCDFEDRFRQKIDKIPVIPVQLLEVG